MGRRGYHGVRVYSDTLFAVLDVDYVVVAVV